MANDRCSKDGVFLEKTILIESDRFNVTGSDDASDCWVSHCQSGGISISPIRILSPQSSHTPGSYSITEII